MSKFDRPCSVAIFLPSQYVGASGCCQHHSTWNVNHHNRLRQGQHHSIRRDRHKTDWRPATVEIQEAASHHSRTFPTNIFIAFEHPFCSSSRSPSRANTRILWMKLKLYFRHLVLAWGFKLWHSFHSVKWHILQIFTVVCKIHPYNTHYFQLQKFCLQKSNEMLNLNRSCYIHIVPCSMLQHCRPCYKL